MAALEADLIPAPSVQTFDRGDQGEDRDRRHRRRNYPESERSRHRFENENALRTKAVICTVQTKKTRSAKLPIDGEGGEKLSDGLQAQRMMKAEARSMKAEARSMRAEAQSMRAEAQSIPAVNHRGSKMASRPQSVGDLCTGQRKDDHKNCRARCQHPGGGEREAVDITKVSWYTMIMNHIHTIQTII